MKYTIIGRIVKENFYNGSESTVGYYVIDDNGNHNYGSVPEIYQLYREKKISDITRIGDFDTKSGEFNFSRADKSLFPKYSISLFNNTGVICSVSRVNRVCRLQYTNGNIQVLSEQEVIDGVRNGNIRLNNATLSGDNLSINNAIIILRVYIENGQQTRFSVVLPNGEITVLSRADLVENLIKQQNLKLFNAKIDSGKIIPYNSSFPTTTITPDGIEESVIDMDYTDTFYIIANHKVEKIVVPGEYSGTVKNGKPHGKGRFSSTISPNDGCVLSFGDYVMTASDYVYYNGTYVNGVKQGKGSLMWSYCIMEQGKIKKRQHYLFDGEIKDNLFDGQGVLYCSNAMYAHTIYEYKGKFEKGREVDFDIQQLNRSQQTRQSNDTSQCIMSADDIRKMMYDK